MHVRSVDRGAALRIALFLLIVAGILAYVQWQWSQPREVGQLVRGGSSAGGASRPALSPQVAAQGGTGGPAVSGAGTGPASSPPPAAGGSGSAGQASAPSSGSFWVDARLARDRDLSRQMDLLQTLAADAGADAKSRDQARQELIDLEQTATEESQAEELIKARGFADALVYLFPKGAEVIVASPRPLTRAQAAAVGDVVAAVTGLGYDQIRILGYPPSGS
ncbi:MAG: SpoIIIAH-like family protein [Clostridia bacterium]|nr:SpoIIIAH-like family protein [Clostridia bacterium]